MGGPIAYADRLAKALLPEPACSDPAQQRRLLTLLVISWSAALISIVGHLMRVEVEGVLPRSTMSHVAVALGSLACLSAPLIVRVSKSIGVAVTAVSVALALLTTSIAAHEAGVDSPPAMALMLLPLFATLLGNEKIGGAIAGVAALCAGYLMWCCDSEGVALQQLSSIRGYLLIFLVLVMYATALGFERNRVRAESELNTERELLLRIAEGTSDGLFDWGLERGDVFYSGRYLEVLGFDAQAQRSDRGPLDRGHVHEDDAEQAELALSQLLKHGTPLDLELRLIGAAGEARWVQMRAGVLRNRQGHVSRVAGSIRDIGPRKKAEALKDQFVSTVSHELRTPLTSIRGALDLLNSGILKDKPDKSAEMLGIARRNSARLGALVDDLLDLQRLRSGASIELAVETVRLQAIVSDAAARISTFRSDVEVRVAPPTGRDMVLVDAARMNQVVTNLLSNAIKFSRGGGVVHARVVAIDARVRVEVQDTGPGIAPGDQVRIFEAFEQADGSSTREHAGSGLGLAISRAFVERMGGELGVVSELGQGATFWVEFPAVG